jgi:hypothetical protein
MVLLQIPRKEKQLKFEDLVRDRNETRLSDEVAP